MAEAAPTTPTTLSEQYLLKEKETNPDVVPKAVEVEQVENPPTAVEIPAAADEEAPASAAEEKSETNSASVENNAEDVPPAAEESNEITQEENSGEQDAEEEKPEIKLETAPADYRFPTTNQTRHCFTRYIEYHRCTAAKGEGAPECDKYAKYYRSLCPTEWIERWNEQRENGTFPGPL